jgi:periplasmic protein TonB
MQSAPLGSLPLRGRHLALPRLPRGNASKRRLRLAVVLSLGLHAILLVGLLLWFRHAPLPVVSPQTEGTVELLLVEHRGSGRPVAPAEPAPPVAVQAPPVPPVPAPPVSVQTPPDPPAPPAPPTPQAEAAEMPLTTPAPPAPPRSQQGQPAVPRPPREAPRISLGGSDETDAIAFGPHIVPASIDAKYHNREPVYPADAARRSEQGAVILLIHVSPDGLPTGVDIAQTSGFASLDRAARDAVTTWHFLPAIKDGSPIAFDMALRVVFHLE